jgi:hypothetical protein
MLAATAWLSKLYHIQVADTGNSEKNEQLANTLEGVDLNIPLTYADRFRIRKPGSKWNLDFNPPHVDGACFIFGLLRQSVPSFRIRYSQEEQSRDGKTHSSENVLRIY